MKIRELTEATYENIRILKLMADFIVKNSERVEYRGWRGLDMLVIGTFSYDFKNIVDQLEKTKWEPVLEYFRTLKVFYVNDPNYEDRWYGKNYPKGYYNPNKNEIFVFFHYSMQYERDAHIKEHSDYYKTLIHELRHMVQFAMFGEFATKDQIRPTGWSEKKIEWDAVFHDVIDSMGATEDDVFTFSDIKHLADEVIGQMNAKFMEQPPHVKLPDKVADKYYKQSIKFFLDQRREYLNRIWQKNISFHDEYSMGYVSLNDFLQDAMNFYNFELLPAEKDHFRQKSVATYRKLKSDMKKSYAAAS